MEIRTYCHWGTKGYQGTSLPQNESQAVEQYAKATAHKPRECKRGIEGTRGVTIFHRPITVRAIVRGLDPNGNPTMYLLADEDAV